MQFPQIHQAAFNETQEISNLPYINVHPPMGIYLLQNQLPFSSNQPLQVQLQSIPNHQHQIFQIPNTLMAQYPYIAQLYNIQTQQPLQNQVNYDHNQANNDDRFTYNTPRPEFNQSHSTVETKEDNSPPINQVFKNNCSDDNAVLETTSKGIYSDIQKSKELFAEIPSYEIQNLDGDFGVRGTTNRPLSYRGAVHFRVETPRPHARNERFYFTTVVTPVSPRYTANTSQEGINKLVESTQDLITSEDLIKINNAIEKHLNDQSDDIIKPRPRFNSKIHQSRGNFVRQEESWRKNQTVKDKIREIFGSDIKPVENDNSDILETNSNHYKFTAPIVVTDTFYDSKDQIVDNIVSTMIPYIEDGYQIVSVKSSHEGSNTTCKDESPTEETVKVTPRPLGENYLAPITVGLRLLNANGTINSFEDFETSDSEIVSNTVANPNTKKTIVEIQESFPIEITHINDVEVHEYLEDGRSNDKEPFGNSRTLYNKYIDALTSSRKIQENINKILYKYGTMNNYENPGDQDYEQEYMDSKENLESSENIQTEVQVKPERNDSNQRSEFVAYENNYSDNNQKIIQPIVIEKEVPVTKFVNRFIEKEVSYSQNVEVPVPVDRPVSVAVPMENVVEKPVEVTRYIDKPYPVEVPRLYPVEVKVPYPVEQKVYVDRPVHVPYPVEKVVEKQVVQHVPVPTPIGIPYEVQVPVKHHVLYPIGIEKPYPVTVVVDRPVPVEKVVHKEVPVPYPVEKRVLYPVPYETKVAVPYPVERRVPVPVEKIVEKPVTVTKIVEKPVHIEIPVPHPVAVPVHVPQPVPVDRIVEKNVPYPVLVDRVVEKKVPIPYSVEKVVERIVQKPFLVTKYVDKPYPVERRVPYPVEKIVEKKVPYPVQIPVEVKVPYPVDKIIEKQVSVPVYRYMEKGDESRTNYHYQNQENNQQGNNLDSNYSRLKLNPNIQTTLWGNQNASTFKYNYTQDKRDFKASNSLKNYLNYLVNLQNRPYQYVPLPLQDHNSGKNKNHLLELKLRRTDRVPKVTKLNIEYGGFRPPLIPSTEVDLDGLPVNKE